LAVYEAMARTLCGGVFQDAHGLVDWRQGSHRLGDPAGRASIAVVPDNG